MKKILYLIVTIIMFLFYIISFSGYSIAEEYEFKGYTGDDGTLKAAESWGKNTSAQTTARKVTGTIIRIIRIVGTGMAIIMLTYVAIKYMSVAPEEKADFKKSATAYVVGAIVVFAATNIVSIIYNFANTNVTT